MRRALTVGIDGYPFGPLTGCVADAAAVADLLERHHDGSKNFDVRRVTGPPDDVTRPLLREALTDLFKQPAEVALFYFSGHGTENDLGGYLVTSDAASYDEGVPMGDVLTLANESPVSEVVVIVDACHSGHLGNPAQGPRVMNARAEIREGVSILTASRSSEPAVETGGRGVFTTLVCSALGDGAADVLGSTSVASIYSYVDQSLGAWQQRPLFKTHVSSLLSLRQSKPAVSPDRLRRINELFVSATDEHAMDPSYERTDESSVEEKVEIFDTLAEFRNARLVEVVTHEHLYFAAIESGCVRLTPLGRHYWRLVAEGLL
ncbi:MAG: caspase family protein [Actinobacteria bacterium]|nr:caspase family protein [Actinomycetota bacterium]